MVGYSCLAHLHVPDAGMSFLPFSFQKLPRNRETFILGKASQDHRLGDMGGMGGRVRLVSD